MTKEEENRLKFRAAISKVLEGGVGEHGGNGESGGVGGCDGGLAAEFKKCLLLAERLNSFVAKIARAQRALHGACRHIQKEPTGQ
jgi:hypothetical protein